MQCTPAVRPLVSLVRPLIAACAAVALLAPTLAVAQGKAAARAPVVIARNAPVAFATLPAGLAFPEGIAANPANGELFVGTFDPFGGSNALLRFSPTGKVVAQRSFDGPLLGLAFHPSSQKVYIANWGASRIDRIRDDFGSATAVETVAAVPTIGAPAARTVANPDGSSDQIQFGLVTPPAAVFPSPNAMAFRGADLYVSDSFQGAVFVIRNAATCATPCTMETFVHDPLLATAGYPPFGANGLAFSPDGAKLFVANTGDDRVLTIEVATGSISVLAESINGADGLAMDSEGRLWVAANQGDEVVALSAASGRTLAVLGEFKGIRPDGSADGLLFPASLVIVGNDLYVTNLALPFGQSAGEPEQDVTVYTVSRMHLPAR